MGWRDTIKSAQPSPDVTPSASGGWRSTVRKADPTELSGLAGSVAVDQEMPEDVSALDRFKVKNFGNSPTAAVEYLQDKYPQYDVYHDKDQIIFKDKQSGKMKVLDPNTSLFNVFSSPIKTAKEAFHDTTDALYDTAAGFGSQAAGTAAAVAAAPGTLGIGSLPAAALASGATGAGAEALRQGIGKYLGVNKEVDAGDVALAGGINAAMPVAFGTGAGKTALKEKLAPMLKEALASAGAKETAEAAANEKLRDMLAAQRGIPGRIADATGLSKIPINVASFLTSQPVHTLRNGMEYMPVVEQWEKEGLTDPTIQTQKKVMGALNRVRQETGEQVSNSIKESGATFDAEAAAAPLRKHIEDIKALYPKGLPAEAQAEVDAAQGMLDDIFSFTPEKTEAAPKFEAMSTNEIDPGIEGAIEEKAAPKKQYFDEITPEQAMDMQDRLRNLASFRKNGNKLVANNGKEVSTARLEGAAGEGYGVLNEQFNEATGGASQEAKDAYAKNERTRNDFIPAFRDTEATRRTLSNPQKKQKQLLLEKLLKFDKDYGTNLFEDVGKMDAYNTFGKPELGPVGKEFGWEAAKKRTGASLLGGGLGYWASGQLGGDGHGGGVVGGVAGGSVGAALSGPQAVRSYINMIGKTEGSIAARQAAISIWNMMHSASEQNDKKRN